MSKRHLLLTLLSAALIGGCASYREHFDETTTPAIKVVQNDRGEVTTFTVVPYFLYFKQKGEVEIVWRLDPRGPLRFPEDKGDVRGIVIEGEIPTFAEKRPEHQEGAARSSSAGINRNQTEIVDCKRRGDYEYVCRNNHSRPGVFKYTIRLTDGKNSYVLDPFVDNW